MYNNFNYPNYLIPPPQNFVPQYYYPQPPFVVNLKPQVILQERVLRKRSSISKEEMEGVFHLPQSKAAKKLSVSVSTVKKRFKEIFPNQVWPYKPYSTRGEIQFYVDKVKKSVLNSTSSENPHIEAPPVLPLPPSIRRNHEFVDERLTLGFICHKENEEMTSEVRRRLNMEFNSQMYENQHFEN